MSQPRISLSSCSILYQENRIADLSAEKININLWLRIFFERIEKHSRGKFTEILRILMLGNAKPCLGSERSVEIR